MFAPASVAVSARFLALASRSSESLFAARSAAAVSRDRRLSAAAGLVGAALRGDVLLGARIVVGAGVVAVGGRVAVDQRRETVVPARLVGLTDFAGGAP